MTEKGVSGRLDRKVNAFSGRLLFTIGWPKHAQDKKRRDRRLYLLSAGPDHNRPHWCTDISFSKSTRNRSGQGAGDYGK